jgi:hypothetical protein
MKRPFPQPAKDAPAGTIWLGGPISWFSISLIVRADDLIPDDVTHLFCVEPTRSQVKGLPVSARTGAPVAKFGSWIVSLTSAETDEWDVTEAVRLLTSRLPQEPAVWKRLPAGVKKSLSFGLGLETRNQGLSLPADILQFAADRDIDLDFDIYGERRAIEHGE